MLEKSVKKQLLKKMVMISLIVLILVTIKTFYSHPNFRYANAFLIISDILILWMHSRGYIKMASHTFFISNIINFTLAPFIGIGGLCDIIVFPVGLVWVIFFFDDQRTRLIYIGMLLICAMVSIYQVQHIFKTNQVYITLVEDMIISAGMLVALILIMRSYFYKLSELQNLTQATADMLKVKNDKLQEYINSNLQLENFAHIASHELKTPVRGISNYAGLLQMSAHDKLDEREKEYLAFIQGQTKQMYALTGDLLDLAKLSNGAELKIDHFDLRKMVEELVASYDADERSVIHIELLPSRIRANEKQLITLFKNLIDNALRYGQSDREMHIRIHGTKDASGYRLHVEDNGPGIDEEHRDHVFLIFKRLHTDDHGTGIGLALCKRIMDNHGGTIDVSQSPSGGASFNMTLPLS